MSGFPRSMGSGVGGFPGNIDGGMMGSGACRPRQGGFSSFQSFDSARPEGQQMQIFYQPHGDYDDGRSHDSGGGMARGYEHRQGGGPMYAAEELRRAGNGMFSAAVAARRRQRQGVYEEPAYHHVRFDNRDGGQAESRFMDEYQRTGRMNPQYASQYEKIPRQYASHPQQPQDVFYESDEKEGGYYGGARSQQQQQQTYESRQPRLSYAPQQNYTFELDYSGSRSGSGSAAFSDGIWGGGNPFR
jgi:hypothetical protein